MPQQRQELTLLFSGDVVGEPGRRAIRQIVPLLRSCHHVDLCIANGENSAGGAGITPRIFAEIRESGVDVVTTGDHIWDQKEIVPFIDQESRLLRAANYPPSANGKGSVVVETADGIKVGVLNVMGRTFMQPEVDCPFRTTDRELEILRKETPIIFVDFHAETTSETIAFARYLDGRVSAVVGTHSHVQTADEEIFPGGTAFLCDAGMTGPHESVLGREIAPVIERFRTQMPRPFPVAKGNIRFKGVLIKLDPLSGRATHIERLNIPLEAPAQGSSR
jgi:2',3'-cyclic-nucleotide 2'-phosphodiesterase